MIPNIKFYVISIAAIFAALGVGIFVGFLLDAQDFIIDQRQDIVSEIEERFDYLSEENKELKEALELENDEKEMYKDFIDSTYREIIRDKLAGINVAIIETNNDYVYSGIGQVLEVAGANVINLTTIMDKFMNDELLYSLYDELGLTLEDSANVIEDAAERLTETIIKGEVNDLLLKLDDRGFINLVGPVNKSLDCIIIAGGSMVDPGDKINLLDKTIINVCKNNSISVIGIEKLESNYSYMEFYKNLGITTIDNIDTTIGKVSLILAMDNRPGHYGVKKTAEDFIPNLNVQ
ncbi:MAG: copper transporter [Tissierellia bacterium]|nr:copper transporter [Tissierellia bacterium]